MEGGTGERIQGSNVLRYSVPQLFSLPSEGVMAFAPAPWSGAGLFCFCLNQPSCCPENSHSVQITEASSSGRTAVDTSVHSHCMTFHVHAALKQLLSSEVLLPFEHLAFLFQVQVPLKNKTCFRTGLQSWLCNLDRARHSLGLCFLSLLLIPVFGDSGSASSCHQRLLWVLGTQETDALSPFLNACPEDETVFQQQIKQWKWWITNLVFSLKNELGFSNQRQRASHLSCVVPLGAYGGVLWSRESQLGPTSRKPLLNRAAFGIKIPGTFLCGHWWGIWVSWEAEAGCSPELPARRPEGQFGFNFLPISPHSFWWTMEFPGGVVRRAVPPCVCITQCFSFFHLLKIFHLSGKI